MTTYTVPTVTTTQSLLCLIPRLIMLLIISLYAPETRLNTCESTYSKTRTGTKTPQTRQRQKRMPPKHCMNLVFSLKKLKFSGRCYANDPQGSSMRDAN